MLAKTCSANLLTEEAAVVQLHGQHSTPDAYPIPVELRTQLLRSALFSYCRCRPFDDKAPCLMPAVVFVCPPPPPLSTSESFLPLQIRYSAVRKRFSSQRLFKVWNICKHKKKGVQAFNVAHRGFWSMKCTRERSFFKRLSITISSWIQDTGRGQDN